MRPPGQRREDELTDVRLPSRATPIVRRDRTRFRSAPLGRRGLSVHQAPWQRLGTCGFEKGPKVPTSLRGSPERGIAMKEGKNAALRSSRDVTRCEHSARATWARAQAKPGVRQTLRRREVRIVLRRLAFSFRTHFTSHKSDRQQRRLAAEFRTPVTSRALTVYRQDRSAAGCPGPEPNPQ